ncbi:MAG: glycoside hydrolase family 95 protein, partial [Bacteroidales bacterium]|nr:glycoside hydrolase family 95 protein [Bacteroidales bacterium]
QTDTSQREQEEAARRYKNYRRELNLRNATATTTSKGEKRAYFTSFAHDVGVVRIKSAKKKRMVLRLDRPESFVTTAENGQLVMRGTLNSGVEGQEGMHYVVRIGVNTSRGHVTCSGDSIVLEGVRKTTLIFSAATSYSCEDPEQHSNDLLQAALSVKYRKLRRDHIRHYQPFFNRVALHLGVQKRPVALPTDQRLQQAQKANDSALDALYFHYGRYLFISSSRPGQLPPNLQGLWAHTIQTPWNGDYHLNINLPMNHWLAEPCNLPELHRPLIDFTKSLVPSGEHTARSFYGAPGWVAHVICNPWHFTAPGEHPSWGATQTGGAWLCQHLWNHYLYNKDTTYCKEVYPTMKGAAEFFLNTLVPDPSGRWLVTAPSISPENSFYMPQGKTAVQVCMGPAMDTQIIKELFSNTIQASELLQTDEEFRNQWQQALDKLAPDQISPQGYLQEWLEDYQETDLHHRHVSHLYGLFPGNSISPVHTPELAQACEKTLERRGDGGTGWSRAWKINFWARLKNGERAYRLLKLLLSPQSTYPNLFCSHPPFQIDGNFGGARGIVEMLLQEHDGFIDLLPALPKAWQAGFFKGLKVPGNIHVSCRWKKGKVRKVILEAPTGGTCTVSANGQQITVTLLPGEKKQLRFTR